MVLVINLVLVLKVALILVMMKKQDLYPFLKLYLTAVVNEKNRPKKIKRQRVKCSKTEQKFILSQFVEKLWVLFNP